ncbi:MULTISPECIES: hypothetical protein [Glutamicibacter]|uniref:hypothetical protein n=1 Tax=Glutamicibacter TaxID=1742989 RepID=UPI0011F12BA2|nr:MULTISPECIES: hypothetical protein [Glutamicibacter]QEP08332.1 hypothetical protein F0M17_14340 [Glutamicibacter sp. ZJUTW]UTM46105.1 hypothetical protein XH9_11080 [Glutamicibacter mysorens]
MTHATLFLKSLFRILNKKAAVFTSNPVAASTSKPQLDTGLSTRVSNTLQPPIGSPIARVKLSSLRRNNLSTSVKYLFEKLRSNKR